MGIRKKIKKWFYKRKYQKFRFEDFEIKNNTVLITGANSGIGLELVKIFKNNNKVLAFYNQNSENLDKISLKNMEKFSLDLTDLNQECSENLKSYFIKNKPNIIINCAVYNKIPDEIELLKINHQTYLDAFKINCTSVLQIIQLVLENNNELNTIINLSSTRGSIKNNTEGMHYRYRSTKACMNAISKSLSIDLKKKFNINVITLSPGEIITELNPNGLINSDICAKKIFHFLSINSLSDFNGKFIDISNYEEVDW